MKYEGIVLDARHVGELDSMIRDLSRDGFRIVNVMDRSTQRDDRFLIVAQKDVDAHIHISGGPADAMTQFLRTGEPDEKFGR